MRTIHPTHHHLAAHVRMTTRTPPIAKRDMRILRILLHRRRARISASLLGVFFVAMINSLRMAAVITPYHASATGVVSRSPPPRDNNPVQVPSKPTSPVTTTGAAPAPPSHQQQQQQQHPRYAYPDANVTRPSLSASLHESRPYLILHVGPPKTATTSLQLALTHYHRDNDQVLQQDGYLYLGQHLNASQADMVNHHRHGPLLRALRDTTCAQEVATAAAAASQRPGWPSCYHRLRRILTSIRTTNRSVILSEEMLSIPHTPVDGNDTAGSSIPRSWDWSVLAALVRSTGFHPLALVGYRRLVDILPSAHQQWERWDPHVLALTAWPHETGFVRPPQALFPSVLRDPRLQTPYRSFSASDYQEPVPWLFTDALMESMAPSWPVRVFTMHTHDDDDDMSLPEHFFCHVLPYAPASCRRAQQERLSKMNNVTISNHHHSSSTGSGQFYNRQESVFYDALTCEAARRGWIHRHTTRILSRREVALRAQRYWQDAQHQGPYDFPLTCPSSRDLHVLLEASLAKEAHIWGTSQATAWRAEHEQAFHATVQARTYCTIDLNATLADPQWKSFFSSL